MKVTVLRLGHRIFRDKRLTTHICLIARAFGADTVIFSGEEDKSIVESVSDIVERWGGPFEVRYEKNWKAFIKKFDGVKVHLTVYGKPIQDTIEKIREIKQNLLIIVGSQKVPSEVYNIVDYNIGVTQQPHSEAAALAVFLHEFFQGKELKKQFENGKIEIAPQEKGKKVIKIN